MCVCVCVYAQVIFSAKPEAIMLKFSKQSARTWVSILNHIGVWQWVFVVVVFFTITPTKVTCAAKAN